MYGIAVSVTLVSLWGRAVVVDAELMSAAAADAATAGPVADRIEDWLTGELTEVPGVDGSVARSVARAVVEDPAVEDSLGDLVGGLVETAALPPGDVAVLDVARILAPAVPAFTTRLNEQGVSIDEPIVESYVSSLDPIVVRQPDSDPVVGHGSAPARTLVLATVVGVAVMVMTGAAAVRMAEDRRSMLRSLLNRFALGALGFALMFQLGSWILDPGAGRAPFRTAASRLVGAKVWLLVVFAGVTGAGAWTLRTRVKRGVLRQAEGPPPPPSPPT